MKRTLALLATLLSVGLVRAMETPTEQKKTDKDGAGSLNRWGLLRTALPELIQERSRETQEPSRPGDDGHKRDRSRSPRNRVQQEQTVFMSKMWTELESILPAGVKDTFKEFMVPDFLKKAQEDPNVLENLFQKFDEISQDPALQEAFDKFFDTPAFQQFMAAVTGQRMAAAMAEAMQFALAAIPEMVANSAPGTMHPVLGPVDQAGFNMPVMFVFGPPVQSNLPENRETLEEKDDGNLFMGLPFANEEGLLQALAPGIEGLLHELFANEKVQQLANQAHNVAERDEVGAKTKAEEVHKAETEQAQMKD